MHLPPNLIITQTGSKGSGPGARTGVGENQRNKLPPQNRCPRGLVPVADAERTRHRTGPERPPGHGYDRWGNPCSVAGRSRRLWYRRILFDIQSDHDLICYTIVVAHRGRVDGASSKETPPGRWPWASALLDLTRRGGR